MMMSYLVISIGPAFKVDFNLVLFIINIADLAYAPMVDSIFGINIIVELQISMKVVILCFFKPSFYHNAE